MGMTRFFVNKGKAFLNLIEVFRPGQPNTPYVCTIYFGFMIHLEQNELKKEYVT